LSRVKGGIVTRKRHQKVLRFTKGHRSTRHALYRRAHESMIHALYYSYCHRRERKADMRRLWITRINAAARDCGLKYSQFIAGVKRAGLQIDRKTLSDIATRDPATFSKLTSLVLAKIKG